jgi:hypothetical protein
MRLLAFLFVVCLFAGAMAPCIASAEVPADVLQSIAAAAAALESDDVISFLEQFDRTMPNYAALRTNVEGLLGASQVVSAIEPISNEGDNLKQTVELDWLLGINEKNQSGMRKETRRGIVKCGLELQGKRWKIVALEPVDFFRP